MLNQRDKDMIAEYIGTYASRLENFHRPDLDKVLYFWEQAKSKHLMNMFGDNLILKREIDYAASPEQLVQIFNSANRPTYKFYNELHRLFFYTKEFDPLIRDWTDNEAFCNGSSVSTYTYLSDRATLMDNVWRLGPKVFPLPNGRSFKVQPGTKISRIFSKLTKEWQISEASWEHVRESQAIALSSRQFKGTLCLSIHPMDYMTMSDNEENWRSCMAWGLDDHIGEYRCGTIEMMNSPYVIVAYVKNTTRSIFNDQWNSKMWRELFIVHPQAIVNVMAYPVKNTFLTKYVLNWLKELAEKANVNVYADEMKSPTEDRLYMTTTYMYNDCYRGEQFVYYAKNAPETMITINYSGVLNCMVCGKIFEPHGGIEDSDGIESALICNDCEPYHIAYCTHCDANIYSEDECYWVDGNVYCRNCYEDHALVPYGEDEEAMDYNCSELFIKLPDETSISPDSVMCRDTYTVADTLINVPDTVTCNHHLIHSHYEPYHNYYYVEYKYAPRELKEACGLTDEDIEFWDKYLYTLENPRLIEDKSTKWDKYLQRVQEYIASICGKNAD